MSIIDSLQISNNPEWSTPRKVFDTLDREFRFTLDVCANAVNRKCPRYFDRETDGLAQDWSGERCWMNPPYGRQIEEWVRKAFESTRDGDTIVVGLLPNRTDTRWWRSVMRATEIRFVEGRLKFGYAKQSAPFGSAIVVWGTPTVPRISTVSFSEPAKPVSVEDKKAGLSGRRTCRTNSEKQES